MPVTLELHPYRLLLRRDWHSARDRLAVREGYVVGIADDVLCGWGDCAPLPSAGTETLVAAGAALARLAQVQGDRVTSARTADAWIRAALHRLESTPAARWAVECAWQDLLSRRAGVTLRARIRATAVDRIPVNAMLGAIGALDCSDLDRTCAAGYRVLKVKLGCAPPDEELARLAQLSAVLPPGVRWRLDANGAWDVATARSLLDALAPLPIESLEEPLAAPSSATLAALQALAPFPLARDESLAALLRWQPDGGLATALADLGVPRLVIKPGVIGGLDRVLRIAEAAAAAGIEILLTSLIESAAGLWPSAQLAAALGGELAQGLATATWLASDLGPPPLADGGWIHLPKTPGSGFTPDPWPLTPNP